MKKAKKFLARKKRAKKPAVNVRELVHIASELAAIGGLILTLLNFLLGG